MLDEDSLPAYVGWCGGEGEKQAQGGKAEVMQTWCGAGKAGRWGVKIAEEKVASEVGGREGFLINDVEKQRLNEEPAPCLN